MFLLAYGSVSQTWLRLFLPLLRSRLGWVVGLRRSAVGVREGRGRDDLTDEIAKKRKRRRASSKQNNVSQRQRDPGAVGQPSTRKVSREAFIIVYFLPRKLLPLALCCLLDRLARGDFLLPRMQLNEPPCLLAIPPLSRVLLHVDYCWFYTHFQPIPVVVYLCFYRQLFEIFAVIRTTVRRE